MATGGEVQGQCPVSMGSEDLDQLKCQPCLKDGNLHDTVGMCIDCQEYLCSQCFKVHTVPTPCRNHHLLDKEQMLQSQIRASPKDICTEKCSIHDDKIVEYYCKNHSLLGCTVCITLDHATCKSVQYIPHEANDLINNEEYKQVKTQLKTTLEAFEKVADNVQKNAEELGTTYTQTLEAIRDYRKTVEKAFDKLEAKLVEQVKAMNSKELMALAAIGDKYKNAHEDLQAVLAKIEALQNSKQNCSLFTEIMRTKDKLKSMDYQMKEIDVDKSYKGCQITFSQNQETLDSLKNSETFGKLSVKASRCKDIIVSAKHAFDVQVKTGTDAATCWITGLALLPDYKLVLADRSGNSKIKTVNVQSGKVLTELKMSSPPWDVAVLNNNKVAVTLPDEMQLVIVSVDDKNISIDRALTVSGTCRGVDYRNDKLAVSFCNPHKVQVLNLQGTVIHTISADKQGKSLFNYPYYLSYGKDDTTLYVSNFSYNNVVCVKLDGTVVAKYRDTDLKGPMKPVVDNHGKVYVCTCNSYQVHQISIDCKKIQVLLTQTYGLSLPYSICLSEEGDKLYVGMWENNIVKVYTTERRTQ